MGIDGGQKEGAMRVALKWREDQKLAKQDGMWKKRRDDQKERIERYTSLYICVNLAI